MRTPRIYTNQPLTAETEIELEAEAARHLLQVLRLRIGNELTLFNGSGHDYAAVLVESGKKHCRVEVRHQGEKEAAQPLDIELAIGISKGDRMDFALQKAVELGVSHFTLLTTERSVVRLSPERLQKRLDHWRKIIIGACEQSGRRYIPEISSHEQLHSWLQATSDNLFGLVLDHRAESSLRSLQPPGDGQKISLLVGPEGGLTTAEVNAAAAAGHQRIRLGPRVLRTETAPLAATAAIQTLWGDYC